MLFAYFIALGHFGVATSPSANPTVQIFYIISGFFLAKKFYSKSFSDGGKSYNQWDYTKQHVGALYPHYIFSLIMILLFYAVRLLFAFFANPSFSHISDVIKLFYDAIPEALLLQNTGFFGGGINYPLWQLCALIIAGYFVYALLCINEKIARMVIFPAAILMIQAFLKTKVDIWGTVGFFHIPLLRAFSPLCIGVLVYYFTTTEYYEKLKSQKLVYNLAAVISLVLIFFADERKNVFLIIFPLVLVSLYDENSWLNKIFNYSIFKKFGDFSYAVYLNHALIKRILELELFPRLKVNFGFEFLHWQKVLLYLVLITAYSILTVFIVNRLKKSIKIKKEQA